MCSQVAESSLMKLWTEMMTITFQAWLIKTLWSFHSPSSSVCGLGIDVLRDFGSHTLKMEVHWFTWLPKWSHRVELCPLKNTTTTFREPAREFPPMTRSWGRALTGKASQSSRAPPWICLSVYPKTRICLFYYFTTFTNSSDINGGLSPITFLWRKSA